MTIRKIKDLKNIQIICRYPEQVKECFEYLRKLGFYDFYDKEKQYFDDELLIEFCKGFWFYASHNIDTTKKLEFYNKKLRKTLEKFIENKKEKEEKEKIEDIEFASDGRVIKINNSKSEKQIFIACDYEGTMAVAENAAIDYYSKNYINYVLKYGLAYATQEARDRAMFKLEIETKLKNIAERLNKGQKIDWGNGDQYKSKIYYNYKIGTIESLESSYYCQDQGTIYCLDSKFLKVAKQEIGEENLIKYFTEE